MTKPGVWGRVTPPVMRRTGLARSCWASTWTWWPAIRCVCSRKNIRCKPAVPAVLELWRIGGLIQPEVFDMSVEHAFVDDHLPWIEARGALH